MRVLVAFLSFVLTLYGCGGGGEGGVAVLRTYSTIQHMW